MGARAGGWVGGWVDGWVDGGWVGGRVDGWVGRTGGRVGGWVAGRVGELGGVGIWDRATGGYRNRAWALQGIQGIVSRGGMDQLCQTACPRGLGEHKVFTAESGFTFADGFSKGEGEGTTLKCRISASE